MGGGAQQEELLNRKDGRLSGSDTEALSVRKYQADNGAKLKRSEC